MPAYALDTLPIPTGDAAFLIGHEECVYMGWRHDTAVKFIYGLHPEKTWSGCARNSYGGKPDLLVCTPGKVLQGRDIVGVSCYYEDEQEWYGQYCILDNTADTPPDTNATCILVAAGVAAAVLVLAANPPSAGVYLTHEVAGYMDAFRTLIPVHEYTVKDDPEAHEVVPPRKPLSAMPRHAS